nr:hypothetical protein [Lysinibacillus timonensis]
MRNWIAMFGSQLLEDIKDPIRQRIIENVEKTIRPVLYHEGQWIADYKRIRVVGMKE